MGINIRKTKRINHTLLYFLKKVFNLEDDAFTKCKEKLENNKEIDLKNFLLRTYQILQKLLKNHVSIKLSSLNNDDVSSENNSGSQSQELTLVGGNFISKGLRLESFMYLTLSNRPKKFNEDELEISFNAVLIIDRATNLSLFNDFEQMIEKCSTDNLQNYPPSGLDLLTKKIEDVVDIEYSSPNVTDNEIKEEKRLYTPFDSDPSQTRILKKILNKKFHKNVLCVDGPPGTGKTQLICNLISNCLIYNQKSRCLWKRCRFTSYQR